MINRFNNLSTNGRLALVVFTLTLLFIIVSLMVYPEWRNDPRWWAALPVAAVSAAIALLDAISGARSLFEKPKPSASLDEALKTYLEWVHTRYSRLDLRGVEERKGKIYTLTLKDIYVSLRATLDPEHDEQQIEAFTRRQQETAQRDIDMAELLRESKKIAITGDPGCGKTTFLNIIASALAEAHLTGQTKHVQEQLGLNAPLPVPIFITLSDYNRYRLTPNTQNDPEHGTVRGFINFNLQHKLRTFPDGFFNKLLDGKQPIMLLLDGLDEVANDDDRRRVADKLQTLIDNKEVEHIIVTSRTRAYQGQSRLHDVRIAAVQPMASEQIQALVDRWCTAAYETEDNRQEQGQKLYTAIMELEAHRHERNEPPLIKTPLMVTVVAIVHYDNKKLPEQRAALYAKCVDVLLAEKHHTATDGTEALREWGGTESAKRQFLALLAFKMMGAGEKAGRTVDDQQLHQWLHADFEEEYGHEVAKQRLRKFVEAMYGRESIIKEVDKRYSFVHLTFQEFLAAFHLAETVRGEDMIVAELQKEDRIAQSWWREVVLLTIGYLGLNSKRTALSLVSRLSATHGSSERQLAAVELATAAFNELQSEDRNRRQTLHSRLEALLTTPNQTIQPATRLLAGDALARLGDKRTGVGVVERNGVLLPDIAWGGWVEAGEYLIGGDKRARRSFKQQVVPIAQAYRLARYPITNVQFEAFLNDGFYDARWWEGMVNQMGDPDLSSWQLPNRPRETVTWYQAVAFCRWLSARLGMEVDLPTEYEWEIAARFGANGMPDGRAYPWGNVFDANFANTEQTGLGQTSAVGIFPDGVNEALNLHDMSGNIWEWCRNKYDSPNFTQVDQSGNSRTLRGGSWIFGHDFARVASRNGFNPNYRYGLIGFRVCVRRPPSQER